MIQILAILAVALPIQGHRAQFTAYESNWIATLDGKELWKEPLYDNRRASSDHFTALSSFGNLIIVNEPGKIVAQVRTTSKYDPKAMILCGDILVYTTENWGWRYEKKNTAKSRVANMNWLEVNKPLRIYDVKKAKLVYHGPLYSIGLPVQGAPGIMTTLYQRNRLRWMQFKDRTPIFELKQVRISDMKVLKVRRLRGSSSKLNEIADLYWSYNEGPKIQFDWKKDRSVEIFETRFTVSK